VTPFFCWAVIELRSTGFDWIGDFMTATSPLLALSGSRADRCVPRAGTRWTALPRRGRRTQRTHLKALPAAPPRIGRRRRSPEVFR
jgi:hypothetical protein